MPLAQARPRWVDDPHLNLGYHVRATALPSPGTEEQLRALAGRVFAQQLDRDKPLWEVWLVEGLEGGRFAMLSKTHHSLVDGISGRGHPQRAVRHLGGARRARRTRAGAGCRSRCPPARSCWARR